MLYYQTQDGTFLPLTDTSPIYKVATTETVIVRRENGEEVQEDRECEPYSVRVRPATIVASWPREDREAVGVFEAVDAPTPEGKVRSGDPVLVMIEGVLTRVWDWADAPPAPARRIMGYTIVARLEQQLGPDDAKQLVSMVQTADPVGYFRLLSSPTGVAVDDERLLASLAAAKVAFPALDIEAALA